MSSLRSGYIEVPPQSRVRMLPEAITPRVLFVLDAPGMVQRYEAAGYTVIGVITREGERCPYRALSELAEEKGASVVLAADVYKGTTVSQSIVPVRDRVTTYHSGRVNDALAPFSASASYSGTSTTHYTRLQPVTTVHSNYYQAYFFLAPRA